MERPLDTDPVTVALVRDALAREALGPPWAAGGPAGQAERRLARYLSARYPRLGHMILAAYEFHRTAIERACEGGEDGFRVPPAAGAVIAGAGLPAPGLPLHARAAGSHPEARFAYTAPVPLLADAAAEGITADEAARVTVALARAADPGAVLGSAPAQELLALGPVSVHVVLVPARWPPDVAARAVAGYARLLPAGSTLCLSLITGDPTPQGAAMMDDASLAGGRGYRHTAEDVAGWIEGAGLVLHPGGVRDARAHLRSWAVRYPVAPDVPGRVLGAVAVRPPAGGG